ncbi:MAG TPA: hypothetical protein VN920_08465 [Pyrinomonadaceae bacterium]|nr:hypothetical protein [Pyrinomonadaceae bacterium]
MRKQAAKGFAMFMLVIALAFATAVVSANGQSSQSKANVPFDFTVGSKTLASGNYAVDAMTAGGNCLKISNTQAKGAAVSLTIPAEGRSKSSKLVFHRYGERYFLAEVWTDGGTHGRQLTKSRQERAIEKERARIASLSGSPVRHTYETVEIATTLN